MSKSQVWFDPTFVYTVYLLIPSACTGKLWHFLNSMKTLIKLMQATWRWNSGNSIQRIITIKVDMWFLSRDLIGPFVSIARRNFYFTSWIGTDETLCNVLQAKLFTQLLITLNMLLKKLNRKFLLFKRFKNYLKQECIPVGCVPPASVAVSPARTPAPPRIPPGWMYFINL